MLHFITSYATVLLLVIGTSALIYAILDMWMGWCIRSKGDDQ